MFEQNLFHYSKITAILKIITIFLVSILCCLYTSIAQTTGKITGTIISQQENSPLVSATIALHKASDSSTITGAITDRHGKFTINANEGDYFLEIKFLGYETKFIPNLKITSARPNINLNEIKLTQTTLRQKEVTVEAEREAVVIGIDSKTFNIDKDLTAGGSTIIDVLKNIPSVNVDMDDNITMNGSTPKILVDGKESNLATTEMLKILSSDLVEAVELITNPSAKYEAEGVSGIIDIKLKKNQDDGFNAMINLRGGINFTSKDNKNNSGIGLNANQKLGKFNFFGHLNYGTWGSYGDWLSERKVWFDDDDTTFNIRNGSFDNSSHWGGAGIGLDYDITDKDVITFKINANTSSMESELNDDYDFSNNQKEPIRKMNYNRMRDNSHLLYSVGLDYKRNFEEKGHVLYVDFYFSNDETDANTNLKNTFYPVLVTDELSSESLKQNSNDKRPRTTFQIDYERPLKYLGNLGAGYKSIFRGPIKSDNAMLNFDNETNTYFPNDLLTDSYVYNDAIHSAYFTLGNKIDNFSYRVGLRTEYTDWKFDSKSPSSTVTDDKRTFTDNYLSWIPTAHLRYSLGFKHTFSISYSRRLERPWYSQLNPFVNLYDSTTIYAGNPDLKQCYYNSYQIDYMLFTPKTTVTTSAFYKNTDNATSTYISTTEWGGMHVQSFNMAQHIIAGASVSFMQTITDWWNLNAFVNLFNTKYEVPKYDLNRQETSWSANMSTTFKLLDNLRLQVQGYYSPETISVQGKNPAFYAVNAGINYEFWDNKMSAGLNVRNLIYNTNSASTANADKLIVYSVYNWINRQVTLSLSYKINNYQQKPERNIDDGGSGEGQQGGGIN